MTSYVLGWLMCCAWLWAAFNSPGAARWPAVAWSIGWFLYGIGLSVWGLVRALAGKAGVGGLAGIRGLGRESAPPKPGA